MNKILILLVCLASVVAAGVLDTRMLWHKNIDDVGMEGIGTNRIVHMSKDDLLKQKILLDVLQHVNQPLLNEELVNLGQTLIMDGNKYIGNIDDEMLHIIELCRNQRMLGKKDIFTITNEDHLRQMIGIYRLLVNSQDWDTFIRNVTFLRMHVNGVLLVNALLLAVGDRDDTKMLIVPGLHEILPELYYDDDLVRKTHGIDLNLLTTDTETMKPNLLNIVGLGRNRQMSQINQMGRMGMTGMIDRSQLWMPWKQMRMNMVGQKTKDHKTGIIITNKDKIVLPVNKGLSDDNGMTLLTEDVGMKSFIHGWINDLCLMEDEQVNNIGNKDIWGRVGLDKNVGSSLGIGNMQNVRMGGMGGMGMGDWDTDNDRLLGVGRRRMNDDIDDDSSERVMQHERIVGGRRIVDDDMGLGRDGMNEKWLNLGRGNTKSGRMGTVDDLPTTNINNGRLLHVNRRRLQTDMNTNTGTLRGTVTGGTDHDRFMNIVRGGRLINDDDDDIHMGKGLNQMRGGNTIGIRNMGINDCDDDDVMCKNRLMHQRNIWNNDLTGGDRQRQRWVKGCQGWNCNEDVHDTLMTRQRTDTDNWNTNIRGIMNMRGRVNMNQGMDMDLPTTTIDNDRLLHVNRRHQINDDDLGVNMLKSGERQRFLDMVNQGVLDGRGILEQDNGMGIMDHGIGMGRNSIGKENLWKMNRRLLNKNIGVGGIIDDDEDIDQTGNDRWVNQMGRIRGSNVNDNVNNDHWMTRKLMTVHGIDMNDDMNVGSGIGLGTRRRLPRSLQTNIINSDRLVIQKMRGGELLLHNLQQLMARINMERISLGLSDILDDVVVQRMNNQRLVGATDIRYALRMNEMRVDSRRNRMVLDKINEIERRLTIVLNQEVRQIGVQNGINMRDQVDIDRVIGDVLMGKVEGVGILNILRQLLLQTEDTQGVQTLVDVGVTLQDPIVQHLLNRIIKIVDVQRQKLGTYKREDLLLKGVTVNDVVVDKLQTYVDVNDADLINLLDPRLMLAKDNVQKMLVARQQRLNHKAFTINIGLTSDRNQRVVVRTLLMPKVDGRGQELTLDEKRLNSMLLDATIVDLRVGQNIIKRKSKEIVWTGRDTTPYTEIYQRVLLAIAGDTNIEMMKDPIVGQTCRFPHRLLLPRGHVDGLPMQMLVIVTPVDNTNHNLQNIDLNDMLCGIGIGTLKLDLLPLGFPLDRKINDIQQLLTLPNVHMKNVIIYHDNKVKVDRL